MAIGLLESFYDRNTDFSIQAPIPSVQDLLAWAEEWSNELGLWGRRDPYALVDFGSVSTISATSNLRPSLTQFCEIEARSANLYASGICAVEQNPDIRRAANDFIDGLLSQAGVSAETISLFKQVLPYKIAHLHQTRSPRPNPRRTINVWIYKKHVNKHSFERGTKDLLSIAIDSEADLAQLYSELQTTTGSIYPSSDNPLSLWHYRLASTMDASQCSNESGCIQSERIWENVKRMVLAQDCSYDAVIVYQVHIPLVVHDLYTKSDQRYDMHKRPETAKPAEDLRDAGMSRLSRLLDNARSISFKSQRDSVADIPLTTQSQSTSAESASVLSSEPSSSISRRDSQSSSVGSLSLASRLVSSSTIVARGQTQLQSTRSQSAKTINSPDSSGRTSSWSPKSIEDDQRQSRYIRVWLKHDDIEDEYFGYPEIAVAPFKNHKANDQPWNEWYFAQHS